MTLGYINKNLICTLELDKTKSALSQLLDKIKIFIP